MTPQEFTYWLQGLFELADPKSLDERQTAMIKSHLALVFTNVTAPTTELGKDFSDALDELRKRTGVSVGGSSPRICGTGLPRTYC